MLHAYFLKLLIADLHLIRIEYLFDIMIFFDELLILAAALSGTTSAYKPSHLFENFGCPKCAKLLPSLQFTGENIDVETRKDHEF